jgi:hypothetical protein
VNVVRFTSPMRACERCRSQQTPDVGLHNLSFPHILLPPRAILRALSPPPASLRVGPATFHALHVRLRMCWKQSDALSAWSETPVFICAIRCHSCSDSDATGSETDVLPNTVCTPLEHLLLVKSSIGPRSYITP